MIKIQDTLQPSDLKEKLARFWELSAQKIHSIEKNYDQKNPASSIILLL